MTMTPQEIRCFELLLSSQPARQIRELTARREQLRQALEVDRAALQQAEAAAEQAAGALLNHRRTWWEFTRSRMELVNCLPLMGEYRSAVLAEQQARAEHCRAAAQAEQTRQDLVACEISLGECQTTFWDVFDSALLVGRVTTDSDTIHPHYDGEGAERIYEDK